MPITTKHFATACAHFNRRDRVIARVIAQVGPLKLRPERDRFGMLVRSIISQQISTSAARSIRQRLIDHLAPSGGITPDNVAAMSIEQLRGVGLSPQKAGYMHDLAAKVSDGTVQLAGIARRTDDAIIAELTQVKGIGRWTAQMFLIFSLGRIDVFPLDDLGVRSAIQKLYQLAELPNRATCLQIGAAWQPYSTIASWYCWRSLELAKPTKVAKPRRAAKNASGSG